MNIKIHTQIILCMLLMHASADTPPQEARAEEVKQVQLWKARLLESSTMTQPEKFEFLCLGLRNMGYRKSFADHDPSVDEIYSQIQNNFLEAPGHAEYFAAKIERKQKEVAHLPANEGERVFYDFERSKYFEVLRHLPSPEAVKVLGRFLYDERDTPAPPVPGQDWGPNPAENSGVAVSVLGSIGLREPPVQRFDFPPSLKSDAVAKCRLWWEEVKSGKRTFSFIGQKAEYRFKPDGTWETIAMANPPNDAPKSPKAGNSVKDRDLAGTPPATTDQRDQERGHPWLWIMGFSVALLAGAIWFRAKKSVN